MEQQQCIDCLPEGVTNGFLGSSYFWYYVILTIIIIYMSVSLMDTKSDWYQSLEKPMGFPSETFFKYAWAFLYLIIFIGVVIAGHDGRNPNSKCVAIGYTILLLMTLLWIISFSMYEMIFVSNLFLVMSLLFTIWIIWLVLPQRTGKNIFPVIAFSLLAIWLVYANYLGWSIQYLNQNS